MARGCNHPVQPKTPGASLPDDGLRGGRMKFAFKHIKGAAYRIPARLLAWLETHPDVAYVTPDRRTKAAWDDDHSGGDGRYCLQQYGLDGSGIGIA